MTNEQLTKVRDALAKSVEHLDSPPAYVIAAVDILDAALAAPEQEPFAWATFDGEGSYDLRLYECNENYRDDYLKRNGDKYAGWVEPLYRHPAPQSAQPMQWIDVSERVPDEAQIVLFVLKGKVVVGAWIAGIFWYDNAKQVATAWMPLPPPPEFGVGGYPVTAPPSSKWQGLTNEEVVYTTFKTENEYCTPGWCMDFARAIESALRAKNTGEQA